MSADRLTLVTTAAMGTKAAIYADRPSATLERSLARLDLLERLWSRFIPTSEISTINRTGGPTIVSTVTADVVAVARRGWFLTGGWFDMTVGRHVEATGYDRSFEHGFGPARPHSVLAAPAADRVLVDTTSGLVVVPDGLTLDLGGVGKGRAADLLAEDLRADGASVAAVSVGGDVRVCSDRPCELPLVSPLSDRPPAVLTVVDGGVAVSGPTKRRSVDGRHHLVDPHTGTSASIARLAVVIAATAADAEMLATAGAVAPLGEAVAMLTRQGVAAWLVGADDRVTAVGPVDRYVVAPGWLSGASSGVGP